MLVHVCPRRLQYPAPPSIRRPRSTAAERVPSWTTRARSGRWNFLRSSVRCTGMGTGHSRVRYAVPWGLLILVLAVLAGPAGQHGRLGGGSDRPSGIAVAAARTAVLPTAVHGTPHLVPADPASSVPLASGTLAASLLLVIGTGWLERGRASRALLERLLAALRRGRGPPIGARSTAPAGM